MFFWVTSLWVKASIWWVYIIADILDLWAHSSLTSSWLHMHSSIMSKHAWDMVRQVSVSAGRHVRDWGAFWEITHSRRVRSGVHPLERQHTITHSREGKTGESSLSSLQLSGELTSPGGRERSEFGGTPRGGIHMKTLLSFWDRLPGFGLMIDSAGALEFMGELFIAIGREKWHQARVSWLLLTCSAVDKFVYLHQSCLCAVQIH